MVEKLIPVEIIKVYEPWAEAVLSNGDTVIAKLVFGQVFMQLNSDGKPIKDQHGCNQYGLVSSTVVQTNMKFTDK